MDEISLLSLFGESSFMFIIFGLIGLLMAGVGTLFWLAVTWKIFTKAGEPGWYAIVPFLNLITLVKIVGRELWWFLLLLIPLIGFVAGFILMMDLAKSFGKGTGYGLGLILLPIIFFPLLAFGGAQYVGPGGYQAYPAY